MGMGMGMGKGKGKLNGNHRAQRNYVSPSDTIMSPCTAKLSAYKSKQFGK